MNIVDRAYYCDQCGKRASRVYVFRIGPALSHGSRMTAAVCSVCIKEAKASLDALSDAHGMTMVIDKAAPR